MDTADITGKTNRGWKLVKKGWPLAFLLLVCVVAFAYGTRQTNLVNGGLSVETKYLDFGEVWDGSRLTWSIPVSNPTSAAVEVVGFVLSCDCTSLMPRAFTIPPGGTQQVDIELNLDRWPASERNREKRQFEAVIIPRFANTQARQPGWHIHGIVKKLVTLTPQDGYFPNDLIVGYPFQPLNLTASYAIPLSELKAHCDSTSIVGLEVSGGPSEYRVTIVPRKDLEAGLLKVQVRLQPEATGLKLPEKLIALSVLAKQAVEVVPPSIMFGAVPVGDRQSQSIMLVSRSEKDFIVEGWDCNDIQTTIERIEPGPSGAKHTAFRVTRRANGTGNQLATVSFLVRLSDGVLIRVPCVVSYHGIDFDTQEKRK